MRLWFDNEFDKYSITVSAGGETLGYPATNLQDYQLAKVTRTTSANMTVTYDLDAGAAASIHASVAGILNHNISTGATAIQFILSPNSDYSGATTSVVFSHSTGIMNNYFTANSERYGRFLITDTANSDDYIEIGRFFITSYLQMTNVVGLDMPYQRLDSSTGKYSITGQYFGDEGENLDLYNIHLPYINNALKKNIVTAFETAKTVKGILIDIVPDSQDDIAPLYCKFNEQPNFNHMQNVNWNCDLSFKEMK